MNGQSVLLSHFMHMRQLQAAQHHARQMQRSPIAALPYPFFSFTYLLKLCLCFDWCLFLMLLFGIMCIECNFWLLLCTHILMLLRFDFLLYFCVCICCFILFYTLCPKNQTRDEKLQTL